MVNRENALIGVAQDGGIDMAMQDRSRQYGWFGVLLSSIFLSSAIAEEATAPNMLPPIMPMLSVQIGSYGIATDETLQLSVAWYGYPLNFISPLPESVVAEPANCFVTLGFVDEQGVEIVDESGMPVTRSLDLMPGGSAGLAVSGGLIAAGKRRARIRPTLMLDGWTCVDDLSLTLEIYHSESGRTLSAQPLPVTTMLPVQRPIMPPLPEPLPQPIPALPMEPQLPVLY